MYGMENEENQKVKLILDNETYEFNIEDGNTLHLELKNANNEIEVKRKQYSNNFSSGFSRVQFNDTKPVQLSNDVNDLEYESSILNVLKGADVLDTSDATFNNANNETEQNSNNELEKHPEEANEPKEVEEDNQNKKLASSEKTDTTEIVEEEKITVPEIQQSEKEVSNDNEENDMYNNSFNINFFGSDVDEYDDDTDDLEF